MDLHEWCWHALADRKKKKTKIYTGVLKEPLPNVVKDTVRAWGAGTHTHTPFLPCNIHQENAYWYATMSAGMSVMNPAWAVKVSALLLCQLDYLFDQRGTWNAGGEWWRWQIPWFFIIFSCQLTRWCVVTGRYPPRLRVIHPAKVSHHLSSPSSLAPLSMSGEGACDCVWVCGWVSGCLHACARVCVPMCVNSLVQYVHVNHRAICSV